MRNPFKRIRESRERKASLQRLKDVGEVFGTLDKLERSALLTWEPKNRRLFICQPLAVVMLSKGEEGWTTFLNNLWMWQYHKESQKMWTDYMVKEETKAVNKVRREVACLSKAEVERIRRARRDEITENDVPALPVRRFEIFILRDSTEAPKDALSSIIACGEYDPETGNCTMAMWEDVKDALKSEVDTSTDTLEGT